MAQGTNVDVREAVSGAVWRTVRVAVCWAVDETVREDVDWAVTVGWVMSDAVGEDSPHPGLQDFLLEAKVEV